MQALVVDREQPGGMRLETARPTPTPPTGEVLVRVDLAGICSTDLEIARGYMGFAGVPGHEFVGTVVAGDAELHGRRIVAEINCVCGDCDYCKRRQFNHCLARTVLGIQGRDGAFAEFLTVPARNCHVVPDDIPDDQAVFVEPLAAALQIPRHCVIDYGLRTTVIGSGRLGLLIAQVVAAYHADLTVVGRNPLTLELCTSWGMKTLTVEDLTPRGDQDVVIEATGSPAGLRLALALVRPLGTIVLKSTYASPEPVDLAPAVINEVRIIGNRCGPFSDALRFLARGKVDVAPLISATYPLSDGVAALAAAAAPENIKVLLRPDPS